MNGDAADPLLLGQRVVAILETGLRTATYKLATLMALIEHCIENMPALSEDALQVPIPDLAHRVLEIYWRQVRPFDGQELRQSTQPRARILAATNELRAAAGFGVDGDAMNAAFEVGGQVVGVLADALERSVTRRGTRRGVAGGQICW